MGANSVTGVGIGDSRGLYKGELHCGGCACGCQGDKCKPPPEHPKIGCHIIYRRGNRGPVIQGGGAVRVRGC